HHTKKPGGERRPCHDFVHIGVPQKADAHASISFRQMWRPETFFLHLRSDLLTDSVCLVPAFIEDGLCGDDVFGHDLCRAKPDLIRPVIKARYGLNLHFSLPRSQSFRMADW